MPLSVAHEQSVNYASWNDLAHATSVVTEFPPSAALVRSKTCKGGGGLKLLFCEEAAQLKEAGKTAGAMEGATGALAELGLAAGAVEGS